MVKRIKFNLTCDDKKIRTLEELKENFTIEVLDYYKDGRLQKWLESRNYNKELKQVEAITDTKEVEVFKNLAQIFDIDYDEDTIMRVRFSELITSVISNKDDAGFVRTVFSKIASEYKTLFEKKQKKIFYLLLQDAPNVLSIILEMDSLKYCFLLTEEEKHDLNGLDPDKVFMNKIIMSVFMSADKSGAGKNKMVQESIPTFRNAEDMDILVEQSVNKKNEDPIATQKNFDSLLDGIINNRNNLQYIQRVLREMSDNYMELFEKKHEELFYKFCSTVPLAVFAMLENPKMRDLYLLTKSEQKGYSYVPTEKKKMYSKLVDLSSSLNYLKKGLGDHFKFYQGKPSNGANAPYWTHVEPKTRKCMIFRIDDKSKVRESQEMDIWSRTGYSSEINGDFMILNGIDYHTDLLINALWYMVY